MKVQNEVIYLFIFFFLSFVLESLLKYISFIEVAKLLSNYFFFFFFLEVNCWQIKWIKWFQYVIIKPFNGKLEGELKVMTTLPTLFKTEFCHLCYVWEISLNSFFFGWESLNALKNSLLLNSFFFFVTKWLFPFYMSRI